MNIEYIKSKVGILFIGLLLFCTSCENQPLEIVPINGQQLERTIFNLDSSESYSFQNKVLTGKSTSLYTGINENDDTSIVLLDIDTDDFSQLPICTDTTVQNIEDLKFTLNSYASLKDENESTLIDSSQLKVYLSSGFSWDEDIDLLETNDQELNLLDDNAEILEFTISDDAIHITLDESVINQWCDGDDSYLVISYTPDESVDNKFIEFYSSNVDYFTSNTHALHKPQIEFNYEVIDDVVTVSQYFSFMNSTSLINNASLHIVDNDSITDFGYIYLLNTENELNSTLDSTLDVNDLVFGDTPIISTSELNTHIEIATIKIKLNDEIIDSISSFGVSLNNVKAYSTNDDIAGDNFSDDNSEGTENNIIFDTGEPFLDYGEDQCPDEFEDGNGGCLVTISELDTTDIVCKITSEDDIVHETCVYNSIGTENNGLLNWEDVDGDGLWDLGEGDEWQDVGSDGCDDSFEDGEGGCLESEDSSYVDGDPNGDNYNRDPNGDDYDDENEEGTEGNGLWEIGEEYLDCGKDGLLNTGDEGEGDSIFNDHLNCLFDTGIDGKYSNEESGYNSSGTQNNGYYDLGELVTDLGLDGCADNFEDGEGGCLESENLEYEDGTDPNNDNENIDPNGDNELGDSNNQFDEGEFFFDVGTDGLSDDEEKNSDDNLLNVENGTNQGINDYTIIKGMSEDFILDSIEIDDADMVIWVSKISPTNEDNEFEITISAQASIEVKYISFKLSHVPLTWLNRTNVAQNFNSNNYSTSLIEDVSIYDVIEVEQSSQLSLNFSYGIESKITFEGLTEFLDTNQNINIVKEHTRLIILFNSESTDERSKSAKLSFYKSVDDSTAIDLDGNIATSEHYVISLGATEINVEFWPEIQRMVSANSNVNSQYILKLEYSGTDFNNIVFDANEIKLEVVHSK